MTLDATIRALPLRLFNRFKIKECVLKRVTEGAYDPATGSASLTETTYPVRAYFSQPNEKQISGGLVTVTDEIALIPAEGLPVEPMLIDKLNADGTDRTIKMVEKINGPSSVALWIVGVAS